MIRWLLFFGLVAGSPTHATPGAEQIFADARGYTAYIETRIEMPFIEDEQGSSFGAGFVVDADRRWLLTNAHVSGSSPAHITAMFAGTEPVVAWPVYIDPFLDLAVLEYAPEAGKRAVAPLDCGTAPGTGHAVGAFGHPNGFKFSGTRGVVSGRTSRFGSDWLQTDAPINGGNSGGPLISLETGRVIGVNTATLDDSESQNANFAVLALQACRVLELLGRGADPRPPALGVSFFREGDDDSLRIAQVFTAGAAAGLRHGDVILGVAGVAEVPASEAELVHLLRGRGGAVRLELRRAGETISLDTRFAAQPMPLERAGLNVGGALIARSNQRDIERLASASPLMVHAVARGSPAEIARLQAYDHLVAVAGVPVRSLAELEAALRAQGTAGLAAFEFLRPSGTEHSLTVDVLARLPLDDVVRVAFAGREPLRRTEAR
jgi:S1-C subfamily serine protease